MRRTQIYLSEKQYGLLKKRAHEQKITLSAVIRATLDVNLESRTAQQAKKKNLGNWLHEMAEDAKRRGVKGPKDLSTNMDKYLYGDI